MSVYDNGAGGFAISTCFAVGTLSESTGAITNNSDVAP
jgi:hypothetical protein